MVFIDKNNESSKSKSLGQRGEEFAREEYGRQGYKIIGNNVFNRRGKRMGEIDFVAAKAREIIFVEVKTRNQAEGRFGLPQEAVNFYKQQRLLRMVKLFLLQHAEFKNFTPRIDVCVVICGLDRRPQRVIIIPNAVEDSN